MKPPVAEDKIIVATKPDVCGGCDMGIQKGQVIVIALSEGGLRYHGSCRVMGGQS